MIEARIFRAVDLETNGVDVQTCEVAQVAFDSAHVGQEYGSLVPLLSAVHSNTVYCSVSSMPAGATSVHGLTAEALAEYRPFGYKVRAVVKALTEPGVLTVSYNGAGYDLVVIARCAAQHGKLEALIEDVVDESTTRADHRECFEVLLSREHVDVYRVWQALKVREIGPAWQVGLGEDAGASCPFPVLHSGMFAGSLMAAHGFFTGEAFDGAHDAGADNRATLRVLHRMLVDSCVTLEQALRWTTGPLPGDVDFDGVFVWLGDQAVYSGAKFRGEPIEKIDRSFLQWMLGKDFHRHTKKVVSEFLAGDYPIRNYEDESTYE